MESSYDIEPGVGIAFFAIFAVIALAGLILMIWAIIDIAKSEFPGNGKLIWLLVVLLAGLIGIIIYFAVGRSQKIKPGEEGQPGKDPFGG